MSMSDIKKAYLCYYPINEKELQVIKDRWANSRFYICSKEYLNLILTIYQTKHGRFYDSEAIQSYEMTKSEYQMFAEQFTDKNNPIVSEKNPIHHFIIGKDGFVHPINIFEKFKEEIEERNAKLNSI